MPRAVDHEATRRRLLTVAAEVFAARGDAATGMRDLAASAGVSTGSLYHYFPDKRALFERLVERTVDADLADLEQGLDSAPPSVPARLEVFFELIRRNEGELQLQSAVLVEFARLARLEGGASLSSSRAAHERYTTALSRLLGVARERADLILFSVSGCLLQRFTDGGATPFEPLERQLRALCATKEAP